MESYKVTQTGPTTLHVEGLPDTVKIVRLDDAKAFRFGDLALHRSDLAFALECLEAIEQHNGTLLIQQALWQTAIVNYFKCFGDSRQRFRLNAPQVYKGQAPVAFEVFETLKALRDKHIAHDENAFKQCVVGAAINDDSKAYKIERGLAGTYTHDILSSESLSSFVLLVKRALDWVAIQVDECTTLITQELEQIPYEDLAAREAVSFVVPGMDDIGKPRG